MDAGSSQRRLPYPGHPQSIQDLTALLRTWGYDPDPYGDFERTGIVVHSGGGDYAGRVTLQPQTNNPAWHVEAIHRSWQLRFECEITRVCELRCLLQLVLRTDLPKPKEQGDA